MILLQQKVPIGLGSQIELYWFIVILALIGTFMVLSKKKISFLHVPWEPPFGRYWGSKIWVLWNIIPSIILGGLVAGNLREKIEGINGAEINSNYALVFGAIVFILTLIITGIITDRALYYFNEDYQEWKQKNLNPGDKKNY